MVNVRSVVTDAFRRLGMAYDSAPVDGDKANVGVATLKELVATLELERFFVGVTNEANWTSTGARSFSIGPSGADVTAPLPPIVSALYYRYSPASVAVEVRKCAWQDLPRYALPDNTSAPPTWFAFKPSSPSAEIRFNTNVPGGYRVSVYYPAPIVVESINDELDVPTAYQPTLCYGLAALLAERYGSEMMGVMQSRFAAQKAAIRANCVDANPLSRAFAGCDSSRPQYDILAFGAAPGGFYR